MIILHLRNAVLRLAALGLTMAATGCGDPFKNDCAATRSCPRPDSSGGDHSMAGAAGGPDDPSSGGGSESAAGGVAAAGANASSGAAGEAVSHAGNRPQAQCRVHADCDNGDPTDGEETCEVEVCRRGNAPPRVVSVTPADGASDVEPDTVVTLTFSEPLDSGTATPDKLRLFDGDLVVAGEFELAPARDAITFTPAAALSLWSEYRIELERALADRDGALMLEPFSASFQVRDGSWSVKILAQAPSLKLPRSLPATPSGSLLATWLTEESTKCAAAGSWVLRGRAEPSWLFKTPALEGACADLSASVAADGNAVVSWIRSAQDYSLTFVGGAWASTERMNRKHYNSSAETSSAFAHESAAMSTFTRIFSDEAGTRTFAVDAGAMRGSWQPAAVGFATDGDSSVQAAFDASGSGFAAWSERSNGAQIAVLRYDAGAKAWNDSPTQIPGSRQPTTKEAHRRGVPSIVTTPGGDAMVTWVEELATKRWLKSSRYTLNVGWQSTPASVFSDPSIEPFSDPPALVYDGHTFVAAWTARSEGNHVAHTARYDSAGGKWTVEPVHATPLGHSALVTPRLGADSRGNLLLAWALAGNPSKLAYRRYRASAEQWGQIELVADVSISNLATEASGVMPFALSANSVGGLLFKTKDGATETLKLAQFY